MYIKVYPTEIPEGRTTSPPATPRYLEYNGYHIEVDDGRNRQYFKLGSYHDQIPPGLEELDIDLCTIGDRGVAGVSPEGVYDYRDQGRYATIEQAADSGWFLSLEAASYEDAMQFYTELRQGTIKPTTPWKLKKSVRRRLYEFLFPEEVARSAA